MVFGQILNLKTTNFFGTEGVYIFLAWIKLSSFFRDNWVVQLTIIIYIGGYK
jgi:hypothetical protein